MLLIPLTLTLSLQGRENKTENNPPSRREYKIEKSLPSRKKG